MSDVSWKCHRRLKFRWNFSAVIQYFINHYSFLFFQSIEDCTKNALRAEDILDISFGKPKWFSPPTAIFTYPCYSNHYFLNDGLRLQILVTDNFFSNYLPLVYFRKHFYIYQKRAGKGRGGKTIRMTVAWAEKNQLIYSLFLVCNIVSNIVDIE